MRFLIFVALVMSFSVAAPAQTLLGNCAGGYVTAEMVYGPLFGNVYCTLPTCTGTGLVFSNSCDSQYVPAVM